MSFGKGSSLTVVLGTYPSDTTAWNFIVAVVLMFFTVFWKTQVRMLPSWNASNHQDIDLLIEQHLRRHLCMLFVWSFLRLFWYPVPAVTDCSVPSAVLLSAQSSISEIQRSCASVQKQKQFWLPISCLRNVLPEVSSQERGNSWSTATVEVALQMAL